jgi:hypothetical protein
MFTEVIMASSHAEEASVCFVVKNDVMREIAIYAFDT